MSAPAPTLKTAEQAMELAEQLFKLTLSQQEWVEAVIKQFTLPHSFWREPTSDIISDQVLETLGDALRIHHAFSRQALSKDRFEYALERAVLRSGVEAALASSRTNRGHDITIAGKTYSLKTEASSAIRADYLHISKFMELGKGAWVLENLRDAFLSHMANYDRILQFRCLGQGPEKYAYELVEIPKALLLESTKAALEVSEDSKQTPKPGYCKVSDANGLKFALYFDGGTERKLQIKAIRKSLCTVHGTWVFESSQL